MIRAGRKEKKLVVDILAKSFEDNGSVNYVIKEEGDKLEHVRQLIDYSFDVCNAFGDVWLSHDENACALVLYPDKKRITFNSILWDVDLALSVIGLTRVAKVLKRESKIKAFHPEAPFAYLWFIGVLPKKQHHGIGSQLLEDVIHESWVQGRPIYLETSVNKNLPWYSRFGFETYQTIDFDFKLFMLRRNNLQLESK